MTEEQLPEEEGQGVAGWRIVARLRAYFLAGILVTAPAFITFAVSWWLINAVDEKIVPLFPILRNLRDERGLTIPGLGLIILVVFLILVGAFTANFLGRYFFKVSENILNRMPVLRNIYSMLKQVFEMVLAQKSDAFRKVVLVEYPRQGIWVLAFVSGDTEGEVQNITDEKLVNVFVPTTPNPTSGFLLFVPKKDLVELHMSVEDGIKMVVSGGLVTPPDPRPEKDRNKILIKV